MQNSVARNDTGAGPSVRQPDVATDPAKALRETTIRCVVALAVVAIAAVVTFLWAAAGSPGEDSLRFEVAKAALQVIAVTLVGAVVAWATFVFQQGHLQAAASRRTAEDRRHEETLRTEQEVERKKEQWNRDVANLRDKRRREDDALRALLRETLNAYNQVKRERRLLRAVTAGGISVGRYDVAISRINDVQLRFEQLARMAPFIHDERLRPPERPGVSDKAGGARLPYTSLEDSYTGIETYLNEIVDEYESHRRLIADEKGPAPVSRLPRLRAFLAKREAGDFRKGASHRKDDIIAVLQKALSQPLHLPGPA